MKSLCCPTCTFLGQMSDQENTLRGSYNLIYWVNNLLNGPYMYQLAPNLPDFPYLRIQLVIKGTYNARYLQ